MIDKNNIVKISVRHEGDVNTDWNIHLKDGTQKVFMFMSIGQGWPEDCTDNGKVSEEFGSWLLDLPNPIGCIKDDVELEYDLFFVKGKPVRSVITLQETIPMGD